MFLINYYFLVLTPRLLPKCLLATDAYFDAIVLVWHYRTKDTHACYLQSLN